MFGLLVSCSTNQTAEINKNQSSQSTESTLTLVANGEDFVRQGFLTKDGWNISFNHLYVNLADVTAYETNPPFNPETDREIKIEKQVKLLEGIKTIDLAEGDEQTASILVNKVNAQPGLYNALSWRLVKGNEGVTKNQTIVINGIAQKDGKDVNFLLSLNPELSYQCGEFVGEERKGILTENSSAEVEVTMHFDHLFGDKNLPENDELNMGALGFEPLAELAKNNKLEVNMEDLKQQLKSEEYDKLETAVYGLGHVGEGHCDEK